MNAVRIESTRENIVVLPPANFEPEARAKKAKYWEGRQVQPKGVTVLPAEYWELIKDREDVASLLIERGVGVLRVVDGVGPTKSATPDKLSNESISAAMVLINHCDDVDVLIRWCVDESRPEIMASLEKRIAIVESETKRGETAKPKK
jgi:hypothetical protein